MSMKKEKKTNVTEKSKPCREMAKTWLLGRVVGHGIARANQKSIVFVPRDPTNPKKLVLEVGNHRQFGLLALLL